MVTDLQGRHGHPAAAIYAEAGWLDYSRRDAAVRHHDQLHGAHPAALPLPRWRPQDQQLPGYRPGRLWQRWPLHCTDEPRVDSAEWAAPVNVAYRCPEKLWIPGILSPLDRPQVHIFHKATLIGVCTIFLILSGGFLSETLAPYTGHYTPDTKKHYVGVPPGSGLCCPRTLLRPVGPLFFSILLGATITLVSEPGRRVECAYRCRLRRWTCGPRGGSGSARVFS